mmetsp:Transcript_28765/g.78970  ORF Transcript_28765/g.78970 Transcript_28765/m.78970 type:complete len:225 (+) Transcript_28765:453-1127(+)
MLLRKGLMTSGDPDMRVSVTKCAQEGYPSRAAVFLRSWTPCATRSRLLPYAVSRAIVTALRVEATAQFCITGRISGYFRVTTTLLLSPSSLSLMKSASHPSRSAGSNSKRVLSSARFVLNCAQTSASASRNCRNCSFSSGPNERPLRSKSSSTACKKCASYAGKAFAASVAAKALTLAYTSARSLTCFLPAARAVLALVAASRRTASVEQCCRCLAWATSGFVL